MTRVPAAIGDGWRLLAADLETELRALCPPGELLRAQLDAHGLLNFVVRLPPASRDRGRVLVREYERRALGTCERCGGRGVIRTGVVLTVLCEDCVSASEPFG